jgi:hypothetical protein
LLIEVPKFSSYLSIRNLLLSRWRKREVINTQLALSVTITACAMSPSNASETTHETTTSTKYHRQKTSILTTETTLHTRKIANEAASEFSGIKVSLASQIERLKAEHLVGLEQVLQQLEALHSLYTTVLTSHQTELEEYSEQIHITRTTFTAEKERFISDARDHDARLKKEHQSEIQRLLREIETLQMEKEGAVERAIVFP